MSIHSTHTVTKNVKLAVNKQNCVRLVEEHCSWRYFSLFMFLMNLGLQQTIILIID